VISSEFEFLCLKKHPFILKGFNDVVTFDDVRVNRGQGYNPSTGVFTAPRKGLYHFSCVIAAAKAGLMLVSETNKHNVYIYINRKM
jgi:hypothetical protein